MSKPLSETYLDAALIFNYDDKTESSYECLKEPYARRYAELYSLEREIMMVEQDGKWDNEYLDLDKNLFTGPTEKAEQLTSILNEKYDKYIKEI